MRRFLWVQMKTFPTNGNKNGISVMDNKSAAAYDWAAAKE